MTNPEHFGVDARRWASAFCAIADKLGYKSPDGERIDEGLMIGWFANAIEQAREHGRQEARGGEPAQS